MKDKRPGAPLLQAQEHEERWLDERKPLWQCLLVWLGLAVVAWAVVIGAVWFVLQLFRA